MRDRKKGDIGKISLNAFVEQLSKEIEQKSI